MSESAPQLPPTAAALISAGAAGPLPIGFGYYPQEGSRVVTAQYLWNSTTYFYQEDLSQLVAKGVETSIQAVFIDNSSVNCAVELVIGGSGQVIVCPPFCQGVWPVFFTGTPNFTILTQQVSTTGTTRLSFLNVPAQAAGAWTAGAPGTIAGSTTPNVGLTSSALGLTASTQVKTGAGRVGTVTVQTAVATAAITLQDGITGGAVIATIPIGAAIGATFALDFPFFTGLYVNFNGGTGTISVSFA